MPRRQPHWRFPDLLSHMVEDAKFDRDYAQEVLPDLETKCTEARVTYEESLWTLNDWVGDEAQYGWDLFNLAKDQVFRLEEARDKVRKFAKGAR